MKEAWHIRGGRIVDPATGTDEVGDVCLDDGILSFASPGGRKFDEIDARGLLVIPGLFDVHVHLREPGAEVSETIATGCGAASAGGFTTIAAMPNTDPPTDTPGRVRSIIERAEACGCARVLPVGCATKGRAGEEPADIADMARAGAVAFSDDGDTVRDDGVMRGVMSAARAAGSRVMDHALDASAAGEGVMREGKRSRELGLKGIPADAEVRIVGRDIELSRETGCPVHIQHVSSAESLDCIRGAKEEGLPVTAEVTPHHLVLTDEDVGIDDASSFKMNPPLGSPDDREALLRGVLEGVIDCIATDHAPHAAELKARGFSEAPFGVVGLETAVGVTYTLLVAGGRMDVLSWLALFTTGPARVLGMQAPGLKEGAPGDLALVDPSEWTVRRSRFLSRSGNTPFEGRRLVGKVVRTFLAGRSVWNHGECRR